MTSVREWIQYLALSSSLILILAVCSLSGFLETAFTEARSAARDLVRQKLPFSALTGRNVSSGAVLVTAYTAAQSVRSTH
jgi:hypothetical protein